MNYTAENYYVMEKKRLYSGFKKILRRIKKPLAASFPANQFKDIADKARSNLENLIEHIPYIGGRKNKLTPTLLESVYVLALIITFSDKGINPDKIGDFIYTLTEHFYKSIPLIFKLRVRLNFFSGKRLLRVKQRAENSQKREFKMDWVSTFVEGDKTTFDYGIDYTECAIYKFYEKMGYKNYMKYICASDFPFYKHLKIGFFRSKTIADGSGICDFRYKRLV